MVLDRIRKEVSIDDTISEQEGIINHQLNTTVRRLEKEVSFLIRRGNLNPGLGISITYIGVVVLAFIVFAYSYSQSSLAGIAHEFIPRFSVVVFIELFAYFFLRLYRSSLAEIKHYQNEITDIELKYSLLTISLRTSNNSSTSEILNAAANRGRESESLLAHPVRTAEDESPDMRQLLWLFNKLSNGSK